MGTRLREQAASGLSIKAWCDQAGLKASSFHYWRNQLAPRPASPTKLIALPMPGGQAAPALELRTPQGYLIRLSRPCIPPTSLPTCHPRCATMSAGWRHKLS
jgi:hypothetical protein